MPRTKASINAICFMLLTSFSGARAVDCPAPFKIEAGNCVLVNPEGDLNWCDANRYCISIGGELINSYSSLTQLENMPSTNCTNCRMWVGVTDLADERNISRSGWQLVNGKGILPLNDSLWQNEHPDNTDNNDCGATSSKRVNFKAIPCSYKNGFVCEFLEPGSRQLPTSAKWKPTWFKRTDFNPSTDYCYSDRLHVANSLECQAAALSSGYSRQVLYNSKLRLCRLLLFSDAQVEEEIETSADWVKFSID